jgi:hypothetical protein
VDVDVAKELDVDADDHVDDGGLDDAARLCATVDMEGSCGDVIGDGGTVNVDSAFSSAVGVSGEDPGIPFGFERPPVEEVVTSPVAGASAAAGVDAHAAYEEQIKLTVKEAPEAGGVEVQVTELTRAIKGTLVNLQTALKDALDGIARMVEKNSGEERAGTKAAAKEEGVDLRRNDGGLQERQEDSEQLHDQEQEAVKPQDDQDQDQNPEMAKEEGPQTA